MFTLYYFRMLALCPPNSIQNKIFIISQSDSVQKTETGGGEVAPPLAPQAVEAASEEVKPVSLFKFLDLVKSILKH